MITKEIQSEFGNFKIKVNHGYEVHSNHFCIDAYQEPKNGDWLKCPCCGLTPKIWIFDNGRSTACGCWNNRYDHFSVRAESIMSVYKRLNGSIREYDSEELRKNWNEYCLTMMNSCSHADLLEAGKW